MSQKLINLQQEHIRAQERVDFLLFVTTQLHQARAETHKFNPTMTVNEEVLIDLFCKRNNKSKEELLETAQFHREYLENLAIGFQ